MTREQKRSFAGVVPLAKRLLFGGANSPKVRKYGNSVTPNPNADSSTHYESWKPESYRWFRQDELVRRCIVINAAISMMSAGFETEIEPIQKVSEAELPAFKEKYQPVKDYVDAVNAKVNLDEALLVAQVKRSIYGKAGFEIVKEDEKPNWLLSVQSTKLEPDVTEKWVLQGFKYDGKETYTPDEMLYFTNLQLENDYQGLSDVEPILDVCQARHNLLRRDFPEITHNLWAPYVLLKADTTGMTPEAEDAFLDDLIAAAKSGKSLAFNRSVEATVVSMDLNLTGLVATMDKLEETILRNFGTPRFLVNKTPENRATAYVEFEAYIQGPIANIQRYFKRALENQWYPPLVTQALAETGNQNAPVKISHRWKPIRASDIYDMAAAVAALYGNGQGILAKYPDLGFDMMGWDKQRLEPSTDQKPRENKKSQ